MTIPRKITRWSWELLSSPVHIPAMELSGVLAFALPEPFAMVLESTAPGTLWGVELTGPRIYISSPIMDGKGV